jgi:hypothetical protein
MRKAFETEKAAIYLHALASAVCLAIGPFQVIPAWRGSHLLGHRWAGRVYVACAVIGGTSSLVVAGKAQGGTTGRAGFYCLGSAWLLTTVLGFLTIAVGPLRNFAVHEHAMQISCALAYAAVTLRLYLPAAISSDFQGRYGIIAWVCWIPNVLFVELFRRIVPEWSVTGYKRSVNEGGNNGERQHLDV